MTDHSVYSYDVYAGMRGLDSTPTRTGMDTDELAISRRKVRILHDSMQDHLAYIRIMKNTVRKGRICRVYREAKRLERMAHRELRRQRERA